MRAGRASHPRVVLQAGERLAWRIMDRLAPEMPGRLLTLIRVGDVPEDEAAGNGAARPVACQIARKGRPAGRDTIRIPLLRHPVLPVCGGRI